MDPKAFNLQIIIKGFVARFWRCAYQTLCVYSLKAKPAMAHVRIYRRGDGFSGGPQK